MSRSFVSRLWLVSLLAAVAAGCALEAEPEAHSIEQEIGGEGTHMVGIDRHGGEQASSPSGPYDAALAAGASTLPERSCLGCGPVPDPWKSGPVPDPWGQGGGRTPDPSPGEGGGPGKKGRDHD